MDFTVLAQVEPSRVQAKNAGLRAEGVQIGGAGSFRVALAQTLGHQFQRGHKITSRLQGWKGACRLASQARHHIARRGLGQVGRQHRRPQPVRFVRVSFLEIDDMG